MSRVRRISSDLDKAIDRVKRNYQEKGVNLTYTQASDIIGREWRRKKDGSS